MGSQKRRAGSEPLPRGGQGSMGGMRTPVLWTFPLVAQRASGARGGRPRRGPAFPAGDAGHPPAAEGGVARPAGVVEEAATVPERHLPDRVGVDVVADVEVGVGVALVLEDRVENESPAEGG